MTRAGLGRPLAVLLLVLAGVEMVAEEAPVLVDFDAGAATWRAVDDVVMGGVSRSRIRVTSQRTGVFEGEVSLENGGGFASVRAPLERLDLSAFRGLALRVRGDGREYQVRLHTAPGLDGVAYRALMTPTAARWQVVELPFSDFVPTYRGRRPADAPPLDPGEIRQLGLMVAGGQAGAFALELDWVRGYGRATAPPERP